VILYSASTDKQTPPPDTGKFIRLAIIAIIGVVIFTMVGNQAVILSIQQLDLLHEVLNNLSQQIFKVLEITN